MENKSNDLKYTTTKLCGEQTITVNIRLNDECKNGHQDFSITGEIYKTGKAHIDRNMIAFSCIHDDIKKNFPEFIPFIKLHLCDYDGVPMHCVANGFYHLMHGFNSKSIGEVFAKEYCEYYRVTPDQFHVLRTAKNEIQFNECLVSMGILEQWKIEAQEAIKKLERLTGKIFINDSKRSNYIPPTTEEIALEAQRIKEGYYTPEAEAQRESDTIQKQFDDLKDKLDSEISKLQLEYDVKKEVLSKGGKKALDACIFYNHTKELNFNWNSSNILPVDYITNLAIQLRLPEGVTISIDKRPL